jgi:hypothetical protein
MPVKNSRAKQKKETKEIMIQGHEQWAVMLVKIIAARGCRKRAVKQN